LKKSTKRSAAKTPRRPHRAPILYVDECLGRGIALRLQSEGHEAKPFDEFAGKRDVDFLPIIGERGWVLVTKDKNIRRNQLEVEAILNAGVRAFVITATNLNHQQIADLVSKAIPRIARISQQRGPFVYNITSTGIVSQISRRTLRRRASGRSDIG
jgi:predicted nuclease of predicted toxin-antitoxin system